VVTFTVDTTAPDAPVIKVADRNQISGTVKPGGAGVGDMVTVRDSSGKTLCQATVQDDYTWSCRPPAYPLDGSADGPITARVTDKKGVDSDPGAGILNTKVPVVVSTGGTSASLPVLPLVALMMVLAGVILARTRQRI
jgi:hypothetical protein